MDRIITIYTDGSCLGNPGPGGWAAILNWREHERVLSGAEASTTNNRMELMAAISALEALKGPSEVQLWSDSRYVIDGITRWLPGWKQKNWRLSNKSPVRNKDLWIRLDQASSTHSIAWNWVKGHADDPMNIRVDHLAQKAAQEAG